MGELRPPLDDVTVLAVEQYGAGPYGTSHLAQLGARIVKIESARDGGDVGRTVGPYTTGEDSLFFESLNSGKYSVSLDITHPDGRRAFERMVATSDVVYSNLRGDVPDKLGITYAHLEHVNPAIVCCSLSAFGMTGPRAHEPGYDVLMQAYAGWMWINGEPGNPPERTGLSMVDWSGGLVGAVAVLAGVHAARRDGVGMDCDLSLFDTAFNMLTYLAAWHLSQGYTPERVPRSGHPSRVPFQAYPTADGWIVMGANKDKFWDRLTDLLGSEQIATDPRFATFDSRLQHRTELQELFDAILVTRTTDEWVDAFIAASIPCAPVLDIADGLRDPQVAARDLIIESEHPVLGTVRQVRSPVRVGALPAEVGRGPLRGEHTRELLRSLGGLSDAEIDSLAAHGVFGDVTV